MSHYKSNVRDIKFDLFEVLGIDDFLDGGHYGDLDSETAHNILDEVARLAEGPVAESFVQADREPVIFDAVNHEVRVPDPLRKTVLALQEAGWWRLGLPEELGGVPAPMPLVWAAREMLCAANSSAKFFEMGAQMAEVLFEVGTPQQKHWAAAGLERGWAGTMVLTEPDAGSDVGAGRTRAIPQEDDTWHIEGVKRFISSADVGDLAENVFHLVLARPVGAGPGTKGLSLFYVPKYHFDTQTLELGARNGVFVTGVEHKMGIKSSPTCELTFGGTDVPAVGWLVGGVHDGIAQMFNIIEGARMMVGNKAAGTLSTGYLNALDYAKQRVQGADLTRLADKTAPRVTIISHPEMRRSLLTQKAYAEGLRSLYLFTAAHQGKVPELAQHVSGADAELAARVNDFLLPIVKGVGSERAYDTLKLSLQVLGGSGFLQDYPLEQYIRDTMIDTLYEGTTAIQAQDFFFRKIVRDGGRALDYVFGLITGFLASGDRDGRLVVERRLLAAALDDVRAMVETLTGYQSAAADADAEQIYKVGLGSVPLLYAAGDLLIGWRLLERAAVALEALSGEAEKDAFYHGKIMAASFFARNVLPTLTSTRAVLASLDTDVMQLDEAAF
ncbi:acyl-CoA dehydrogenase [Nocardia sp. NPDC050630]|uniref:acyl-CoA dehydrogenase n=1 Tax=Nocardia sp. NPDC050630 TaxID=3364321 RepID=UPI0037B170A2